MLENKENDHLMRQLSLIISLYRRKNRQKGIFLKEKSKEHNRNCLKKNN